MTLLSVGDLALNFQNARHVVRLKSDLARLSEQLASGRKADIATAIGGDYQPVTALERSLTISRSYATATAEAAQISATMQTSLAMIQDNAAAVGSALAVAGTSGQALMIETTTSDARLRFDAVISALNVQTAGRYAFSGNATDQRPLQDAEQILSDLSVAVSAEVTASGVVAAVDAWFDTAGGGFETSAYGGSTDPMTPMRLSENDRVELPLTAADGDLREVLKGFALAALAGQGVPAAGDPEQALLTRIAGERILAADGRLALLRGRVGATEARIEEIGAANASAVAALEIARTDMVAADPYKTATELEAVRGQLESLYTVTARLSRLTLAEFLR